MVFTAFTTLALASSLNFADEFTDEEEEEEEEGISSKLGREIPAVRYSDVKVDTDAEMSETSASSWNLASCGVDIVYFSAAIEILL